jgi:hypothetical protein
MAGFSGLALDWHGGTPPASEGYLSLDIARKWDRIVRSAERTGVRFQLVLQHHGQFSTAVAPNWSRCPWNASRGGFLARAEDYFTHPRALELTRMKYRYVVARWGYSTSIMAWELFNEFQYTDAWRTGERASVLRWHREMAEHVRSLDPYRHLVTTSSVELDNPVWDDMDFYQPHLYARDMIAGVISFGRPVRRLAKPVFYGEMGDHGIEAPDEKKADGRYLRSMLWAGLFSGGAGAAQHWSWEKMPLIYDDYRAVNAFVARAGLARDEFPPVEVSARTDETVPFVFEPGGGFEAGTMVVDLTPPDGEIKGLDRCPSYLHGDPDKRARGQAGHLFFLVESDRGETLSMLVDIAARAGAAATITLDGRPVGGHEWPRAPFGRSGDTRPMDRLTVRIPPGRHTVTVSSTGKDWFHVKSCEYSARGAPVLGAVACASGDRAVLWLWNRRGVHEDDPEAVSGLVTLPALSSGAHEVEWWDTSRGEPLRAERAGALGQSTLTLEAPPVSRDVAAIVRARD